MAKPLPKAPRVACPPWHHTRPPLTRQSTREPTENAETGPGAGTITGDEFLPGEALIPNFESVFMPQQKTVVFWSAQTASVDEPKLSRTREPPRQDRVRSDGFAIAQVNVLPDTTSTGSSRPATNMGLV